MVTGSRYAAKTTFFKIISDKVRKEGWNIAGLLSPAIFDQGLKM